MTDISHLDLYALLKVSSDATEKEIKKAFRKKALECHPDKNPNDPKAAELFHQLSKALEILADKSARAAYDRVLKSRKEAEIRHKNLDDKRKKFKEDLEQREKHAHDDGQRKKDAVNKLEAEIERLRKEGSRHLEEERELMRQQLSRKKDKDKEIKKAYPRIKIKWKVPKGEKSDGGYNQKTLTEIFSKVVYLRIRERI